MARDWDEKAVFLEALRLEPEKRDAFLLESCPDETARARIRTLLRRHTEQTIGLPNYQSRAGTFEEPKRLDEFVLLRQLGAGGMGVVYLAEDTVLGRKVAVKVLASHLTDSEQFVGRFRDEARHAASLEHPGIVSVYKFGVDGTHHYIVSEFIDGPTLGALIEDERRRTPDSATGPIRAWHRRCADVVAAIADALDYSHRSGVIHRDVKPSNILIDASGKPRLTDFGIAKQLSGQSHTRSSEVLGSCHYMSPEQAAIAETPVDRRSDIFSLGVVFFEMLALRRPFEGRDANQVLRAVISEAAPRLRVVNRLIPKDLETICSKALEKEPMQRYQTAAHLAADLRCFLSGDPILARPPGILRRSSRWVRRHRLSVALGSCGALVLVVVAIIWMSEHQRREVLAWISVESDTPACAVLVQSVNPDTLELEPNAAKLGMTPLGRRYLPTGDYRITIVAPDQSWIAEFNTGLHAAGRASHVAFIAESARREVVAASNDRATRSGTKRLVAHIVPTSEVIVDADMVRVDEGTYPFGWAVAPRDRPTILTEQRTTHVAAFAIDRREVSNGEYKAFLDATGHPPPWQWIDLAFDPSTADLPIVDVTLADAEAYARWKGKRLPTMQEWNAAACGPEGHKYPWGDDPAPLDRFRSLSQDDLDIFRGSDGRLMYDVYRRISVSVNVGTPDMIGLVHTLDNVREFTATIDPKTGVVLSPPYLDLPTRLWDLRIFGSFPAESHSPFVGFRCAKSIVPPHAR